MKVLSIQEQAKVFGGTVAQCRALHLRNAADCDKTAAKCEASGKKVGGYDGAWWRDTAAMHRAKAAE